MTAGEFVYWKPSFPSQGRPSDNLLTKACAPLANPSSPSVQGPRPKPSLPLSPCSLCPCSFKRRPSCSLCPCSFKRRPSCSLCPCSFKRRPPCSLCPCSTTVNVRTTVGPYLLAVPLLPAAALLRSQQPGDSRAARLRLLGLLGARRFDDADVLPTARKVRNRSNPFHGPLRRFDDADVLPTREKSEAGATRCMVHYDALTTRMSCRQEEGSFDDADVLPTGRGEL